MAGRSSKTQREPSPPVACAHDLCEHPAILRRKLKSGWANLCAKHDRFHAQLEADEFCRSMNLTSTEQKIAWCREHMPKFDTISRERALVHWEKVVQSPNLPVLSYRYAEEALQRLRGRLRSPGEDDDHGMDLPAV